MHGLDAGGQWWTQHLWILLPKQSLVEVLGSTIWQSTSWDVPQISFIVKYLLPSAFWAILREVCALDLLHSFDYVFNPSVLSASVVCKLCMHNPQLPFQCTCVVFMWLNAPVFRWHCYGMLWIQCRNYHRKGQYTVQILKLQLTVMWPECCSKWYKYDCLGQGHHICQATNTVSLRNTLI